VHIKGKKKISVQYFSTGASSGGAYLGLPSNVLGKKYVVASYNDNPDGVGALVGGEAPASFDVGCGEFVVIATENGTNVTITMRSESEGGIKAGESRTVALNRGQCYLVRSKCASNDSDISGSIVESNYPVAVISGHSNAALGSVGGHPVESRDFMIEQMLPVECWHNFGYTGIPFANTDPSFSEGNGDSYRTYSFDADASLAKLNKSWNMSSSRLSPGEKFDVDQVAIFSSSVSRPFGVVQYDQSSQGSNYPYPRPSMMQIVPSYRLMYQFTVPKKTFEDVQNDYICLIPPLPQNLSVAKNGGSFIPFTQAGFSKVTSFQQGAIYKIYPGCYTFTTGVTGGPFMIYQYGFRTESADGTLNDYDGDDNYTSYAMPAGAFIPFSDSARIVIEVDTLCVGWNVCVTDKTVEGGIRSIRLLSDRFGPLNSLNTHLENDFDKNIIQYVDTPEQACCKILIHDRSDSAYAPIEITDKAWNKWVVELHLNGRSLEFYPIESIISGTPLWFGYNPPNTSIDTTVLVVNPKSSFASITINSVILQKGQGFTIVSTNRYIPTTLAPGDSLSIQLQFTPRDTGISKGTLSVISDCSVSSYHLMGGGGVGILSVPDHHFGAVSVDDSLCVKSIIVSNKGTLPFTLLNEYRLIGSNAFSFDGLITNSENRIQSLPVIVPPDKFIRLHICYHPSSSTTDSAELFLSSDIPLKYLNASDSTIKLSGRGSTFNAVKNELQLEELRIHPNPTFGEDITACFGLREPKELGFAVYDMLGREVLSVPASYFAKGKQRVMLPVLKLAEGGYILRVSDGVLTKSISFRMVK
jgi:hypothetical protein